LSARFVLGDVVRWCGASLRAGSAEHRCEGVSIDSRRVPPGCLFVAIRGERHDAHRFLEDAARAGAALLVERGCGAPSGAPTVEVDDTTRALADLAAGVRRRYRGRVVGITGSNGKTSTKELASAALGEALPHLKTEGNLNNHIGVPLTLLRLEEKYRVAIVEMGTNHPGEIAFLAGLVSPEIGVITNVGTAHAEFLGGREEVGREKGSLFEALPEHGVAVANADDDFVMAQTARTRAELLRFGRAPEAEVCAEDVRAVGLEGFRFRLRTPWGSAEARIPSLGEVHVQNALAAAAAALAAGAELDAVAAGLARAPVVSGRLEPVRLGGFHVLNDSYNANPQSMRAAIETLCRLRGEGRALAVLGDMGELGPDAPRFHREVGRAVGELGVDVLLAVGEHARAVGEAAIEAGLPASAIGTAEDAAVAAERLSDTLREGDWVLLKGSRAMRMERVLEHLRSEGAGRVAPETD
jgi:UDP-N-acetylmuramoyl-tripeptide--D-alanyl-D-alanine ligase